MSYINLKSTAILLVFLSACCAVAAMQIDMSYRGDLIPVSSIAYAKASTKDKTAVGEFIFKNTDNHAINIQKILSGCSCTVVDAGEIKNVEAGKSTRLRAVFDVGQKPGRFYTNIIVVYGLDGLDGQKNKAVKFVVDVSE